MARTDTTHRGTWAGVMSGFLPGLPALERLIMSLPAEAPRRVLDLGGGPGLLAERLAACWPSADVHLLDIDPVLLALARGALGSRVRVVEADLSSRAWRSALPGGVGSSSEWSPDAIVAGLPPSSRSGGGLPVASRGRPGRDASGLRLTGGGAPGRGGFDLVTAVMTVHYLEPGRIRDLYAEIREVMAPGGVLVVADLMPDDGLPELMRALDPAPGEAAAEFAWAQWWSDAAADPALAVPADARTQFFRDRPPAEFTAEVSWHRRAAAAAGFAESGLIWRDGRHAALAATVPN